MKRETLFEALAPQKEKPDAYDLILNVCDNNLSDVLDYLVETYPERIVDLYDEALERAIENENEVKEEELHKMQMMAETGGCV